MGKRRDYLKSQEWHSIANETGLHTKAINQKRASWQKAQISKEMVNPGTVKLAQVWAVGSKAMPCEYFQIFSQYVQYCHDDGMLVMIDTDEQTAYRHCASFGPEMVKSNNTARIALGNTRAQVWKNQNSRS